MQFSKIPNENTATVVAISVKLLHYIVKRFFLFTSTHAQFILDDQPTIGQMNVVGHNYSLKGCTSQKWHKFGRIKVEHACLTYTFAELLSYWFFSFTIIKVVVVSEQTIS